MADSFDYAQAGSKARRVSVYKAGTGYHSFLQAGGLVRVTLVGGGVDGVAGLWDQAGAAGTGYFGGNGGGAGETVILIYRPVAATAKYVVGAPNGGNTTFGSLFAYGGSNTEGGGKVTSYTGYNQSPVMNKQNGCSIAGGGAGINGQYKGSAPGYPLSSVNSNVIPYYTWVGVQNGASPVGAYVSRTTLYGGNGSEQMFGGSSGGDSPFGVGGKGGDAAAGAAQAGGDATGFGAGGGGGGCTSSNNSANRGLGGKSTGGLIIVEEF